MGNTGFDDPGLRSGFLLESLIDRGHFRDALRTRDAGLEPELPYLAAMGVIPADSANDIFDRWVRERNRTAHVALDWWAGRADTIAIRRFVDAARARARSTVGDERHYAAFELRAADAYLALARRDTSRAIASMLALPDSLCPTCYAHRLTLAQLLLATRREVTADSCYGATSTALHLRSTAADFNWRVARRTRRRANWRRRASRRVV